MMLSIATARRRGQSRWRRSSSSNSCFGRIWSWPSTRCFSGGKKASSGDGVAEGSGSWTCSEGSGGAYSLMLRSLSGPARARFTAAGLLDDRDRVPGGHRAALGHVQLLDLPGGRRGDLVLHLHRLDHADERALLLLCSLVH